MNRCMCNLYYLYIRARFRHRFERKNFDMRCIDKSLINLADKIYASFKDSFDSFNGFGCDIGYFATELYNVGGHTACLVNLAKSFAPEKSQALFLSHVENTKKMAPDVLKTLNEFMDIRGITFCSHDFVSGVIDLYNMIIGNCPRTAICYTHMYDLLFTVVAHLIKNNTGMKLIFFDHASHYPTVGMENADVIVGGLETARKITCEMRHIKIPYKIVGLQSVECDKTKIYSKKQIVAARRKIGIPNDAQLVVSGGSGDKFFDGDKSPFFETVRDMLVKNKNLYVMVITELLDKHQEIIDGIFQSTQGARNRLIIYPRTSKYDILFQCADVFMDSFPISSAMTQIDLMRMRVASVVKINQEKPMWSFHEYMPVDYPYMYDNTEDMKQGIEYLLNNSTARQEIIDNEYKYWLENYECGVVRDKYIKIIKELSNANN